MSYLRKVADFAGGLLSVKGERDPWEGRGGRGPGLASRGRGTSLVWQDRLDPAKAWTLYRQQVTLWAGLRMVAEGFSSLPWSVQARSDRRRRAGGWEPQEGHKFEQLIEYPNDRWTRKAAHKYLALQQLVTGNSLTRIVYEGGSLANQRTDGTPSELWPIAMSIVKPEPQFDQSRTILESYAFKRPSGAPDHWLPRQVIHTMMTDEDPNWGRGVPEILQRVLEVDTRAVKWQAESLDRGRPSILWKDPNLVDSTAIKEVRAKLKEALQESGSRDPIVVGAEGGIEKLFESALELDLTNSRRELRAEIAIAAGLLPTMFSFDAQTENNMRMAVRWMLRNAILPLADTFRDAYNTALVPRSERKNLWITYTLDGVESMIDDMVQKLAGVNAAIDASIPPNDAYDMFGVEANLGTDGDKPMVPTKRKMLENLLRPAPKPAAVVGAPGDPSATTATTPPEGAATDPTNTEDDPAEPNS